MAENRPPDPQVAAVFAEYPTNLRRKLMRLRRLILDTASATEGVGDLEESLRWGQPSYLTSASKSGTTVRIDRVKDTVGRYAMHFHCQTTLVATFRELYPEDLAFDGNRSIVFEADDEMPEDAVRHCISLALTYHLHKRRNYL